MRYVRYRIPPLLAGALGDLHGTALGRALSDRLEQLATAAAPTPAEGEIATKPADVKSFAPMLPTMHDWIFPITREVDVHPVLYFREHLRGVGLLRKNRGTLLATVAGRRAAEHPAALWQHLADRIGPASTASRRCWSSSTPRHRMATG